jgi:hypothetical protein
MPLEEARFTPAEIGDALAVIALGGDPQELAAACRQQAPMCGGEARQRLLRSAAILDFAGETHAAMVAELAKGPLRK